MTAPASEPRLLIKRINALAEEAGELAIALGLPLADAERLFDEARRRGIAEAHLAPLRDRLAEIDRLKARLEKARSQRATKRL